MDQEIQDAYNKAVKAVLPEVARKFMNVLIETVPVDTGLLKQSIVVESDQGEIVISMLGRAKYVEWGTRDHFVQPKTMKALHWTEGKGGAGKDFFSKGHMVRGIEVPSDGGFIRPAINLQLNQIFTEEIARHIKSQSAS